jgi:hexulose-6-phosphate isomerase
MSDPFLRVGFMQGRLSPLVGERIQAFPGARWADELTIAKVNKIKKMEWTIDTCSFASNPLVQGNMHASIRVELKKNEIQVPSVTCDYFMENPHWQANGVDIERDISRILEGMSLVGASILVIPLVDNSSIKNNPGIDLNFFSKMEKELIRRHIRIAFEVDLNELECADFIENFPPDNFGINYDIGNSASYGFDPEIEISNYGDRIFNVHVKDRVRNGGTVPLGHGDADFATVIKNLSKNKYEGNFIMQTARAKDRDHVTELNRNIFFFMKVMKND